MKSELIDKVTIKRSVHKKNEVKQVTFKRGRLVMNEIRKVLELSFMGSSVSNQGQLVGYTRKTLNGRHPRAGTY